MREINKNTILDSGMSFEDTLLKRSEYINENTAETSFENIFGDLSDCVFIGDLHLTFLGINSLKGIPCEVRNGNFIILGNENLKSLDYFPEKLTAGKKFGLNFPISKESKAPSLRDLNIDIYKDLNIVIYQRKGFLSKDFILDFQEFRAIQGDFQKIHFIGSKLLKFNEVDLEKLYQIFKKTNFDKVKFDRALELL